MPETNQRRRRPGVPLQRPTRTPPADPARQREKLAALRRQEKTWMRRLKSAFTRLTKLQERAAYLEKKLKHIEGETP